MSVLHFKARIQTHVFLYRVWLHSAIAEYINRNRQNPPGVRIVVSIRAIHRRQWIGRFLNVSIVAYVLIVLMLLHLRVVVLNSARFI